jgi:hypothetical protein
MIVNRNGLDVTIRNCLGEERAPDKVWADGSHNCPFCTAAVSGEWTACHNPACTARGEIHSSYPVERARAELAAAEGARAREQERQEIRTWQAQYAREQATEREQRWTAAVAAESIGGPCAACLQASNYRKSVRHRKQCPLTKKVLKG